MMWDGMYIMFESDFNVKDCSREFEAVSLYALQQGVYPE